MRRSLIFASLLLVATPARADAQAGNAGARAGTQVVDRIMAIVEGEVITLSEVRELGAFNRLTGGSQVSNEELLQRLINQWIVTTEAANSGFPSVASDAVERAQQQIVGESGSLAAYHTRLRDLGLDEPAVRRQLQLQLLLSNYLDYKYRFLVRIEEPSIAAYYREQYVPQLRARGEAAAPLDAVREQIREILVQQAVTGMAQRWLDESRARLHIELREAEVQP